MMKQDTSNQIIRWAPTVALMAVIFYFSGKPNIQTGVTYDFFLKKTAHLFEYGLLALSVYRSLGGKFRSWSFRTATWAWVVSALYGASDEFHQWFVPTRSARLRDVAIDAVGAMAALALFYLVTRYIKRHRVPRAK